MIGTMQSGGVSKSMVNLLNAWDREKYDTSLLLCCKAGDVFSQYLPKGIRLLYDERIEYACGGVHDLLSVIGCRLSTNGYRSSVVGSRLMETGEPKTENREPKTENLTPWWRIKLFFGIIVRLVLSRFSRSLAGRLIARMMPVISDEEYDLIVDYGGQQQLYYMVDKLKGKKKVTFFHNDYSKWPYYYKADKKYYPKVDYIFSISQVCVDALKRYFPDCTDKISVMENIVSPDVVRQQSKDSVDDKTLDALKGFDGSVIATVAHICRRKGSDLAFEAARLLKARGVKFKWLFVGNVLEPELVDGLRLSENGYRLSVVGFRSSVVGRRRSEDGSPTAENREPETENLIFLGVKSNPYPYMRIADIYCQPSRFEGKSISLDEAKILCKPIVVTNFSTVHDQFENCVNASICDMTAEDLADKLEELINNVSLRKKYSDYLAQHVVDNSSQVEKLYAVIG